MPLGLYPARSRKKNLWRHVADTDGDDGYLTWYAWQGETCTVEFLAAVSTHGFVLLRQLAEPWGSPYTAEGFLQEGRGRGFSAADVVLKVRNFADAFENGRRKKPPEWFKGVNFEPILKLGLARGGVYWGRVDRRLKDLPKHVREVAEDFLTLHKAWDTAFEASGSEHFLWIHWPNESYKVPFAEFKWSTGQFGPSTAPWYASWRLRWVSETEAGEACGLHQELRHCMDFGVFLARFRQAVVR